MTPHPVRKTRTIVIDDDPIFRSLATSKLSKHAHEVVECSDGTHAWSLLSQETFHLAIVALEVPQLRADELIRCIRGHHHTRHLPVIVITSRNDSEAIRNSLDAGATSFLTKPINWSLFADQIEYLLRLTSLAERGRRTQEQAQSMVESLTAVIEPLSSEIGAALDSIARTARAALAASSAPGSQLRMADALQAVVVEAERAKANLSSATGAIGAAAAADTRAGYTSGKKQPMHVS